MRENPDPGIPRFRLTAMQRLEDAEILRRNRRFTGAMYMASYAVECILKALLLSRIPNRKQNEVTNRFRGSIAHNFDWLRHELGKRKVGIPRELERDFIKVNTGWAVKLRYLAGPKRADEADSFLEAVTRLVRWADRSI